MLLFRLVLFQAVFTVYCELLVGLEDAFGVLVKASGCDAYAMRAGDVV